MFCSHCGKENAENSKFCVSCGAKMHVVRQTPVVEPVQQPVQPVAPQVPVAEPVQQPVAPAAPQVPVVPVAQQTPVADAVLQQPVQPAAPQPAVPVQAQIPAEPPKKKKGKAGIIVIIILLMLVLLSVAGFLAFRLIKKGEQAKKVSAQLETAKECMDESDYEGAIDAYLTLLTLDAENEEGVGGLTDAYIEWANSYVEAGEYDAAIALLEEADDQADEKDIAAAMDEAVSAKTAYEEELAEQTAQAEAEAAEQEAARLEQEAKEKATEMLTNYLNNELIPYYGVVDGFVEYQVPYVRTKWEDVTDFYERENLDTPTTRVWDNAGVLGESEEEMLTALIEQAEAEIGCDIVILTINESVLTKYGATDSSEETWETCMEMYANDFYQENGYGFDKAGGDGVLLLDNWYEGESGIYMAAYGKVADTYTEELIDEILTRVNNSVVKSPWRAYGVFAQRVWMEVLHSERESYTFADNGHLEGVEGILNYDIRDYDGDGQDELFVLINLDTTDESGAFCNIVSLWMFEAEGDAVVFASDAAALQPAFGGCDMEKDNFYLKEADGKVYVGVDCKKMAGMLADGTYMGIGLWEYNGTTWVNQLFGGVNGSDFTGSEDFAQVAGFLNEYGFTASAAAVNDGSYSCMAFDAAGDDMELFFSAEGLNSYLLDYAAYAESEDYRRWSDEANPAGLGKVVYRFSIY